VFGVRYLATLFGFVFFGHQLGAFSGVWLGGYVFDAPRSYDAIWLGRHRPRQRGSAVSLADRQCAGPAHSPVGTT